MMEWLRSVPLEKDFFIYLYKLLGGIPGTWFSQRDWDAYFQRRPSRAALHSLTWRRVDVRGAVGPGTANQSSSGTKKKKRSPKNIPTVEPFCVYYLSGSGPIGNATASDKLSALYSASSSMTRSGIWFWAAMMWLAWRIFLLSMASRFCRCEIVWSRRILLSWRQAMTVGEPPLHHNGFTGGVLHILQESVAQSSTEWKRIGRQTT